jgi:hypothetical protein
MDMLLISPGMSVCKEVPILITLSFFSGFFLLLWMDEGLPPVVGGKTVL